MKSRLLSVVSILLFTSACITQGVKPFFLSNEQSVTLQGVLRMEPAGRLQFVTIETQQAYIPVTQDEQGRNVNGELLHEIGLDVPIPYATLYALRGKKVTIKGKMQTDSATPYFWHETRLNVTSMQLANGTELVRPKRHVAVPPEHLHEYIALAILPGDLAAPWQYRIKSPAIHPGVPPDWLGCQSNGGGDVVNCFCADGFHPTAATSVANGVTTEGIVYDFAQFSLDGEDGETALPVTLIINCSRR